MKDLTKLADALENIAHMEYPSAHHDGNNLREAARILRAAGAADVGGLMAMVDAHGFANYREGFSDGTGKGAAVQDAPVKRAALESALRVALAPPPVTELPMQPIVWAADGCIRFKENRLVRKLLEHSRAHGFGLNELAMEDATEEERMQLAQLIGYSVSGYGGLSYVTDESADKSQDIADAMIAASQAGAAQEPKP